MFRGGISDLKLPSGCAKEFGAGGRTRTDMRSEPRQILSLVRIPISPLRRRRMDMIRPFRVERNFSSRSSALLGQAPLV